MAKLSETERHPSAAAVPAPDGSPHVYPCAGAISTPAQECEQELISWYRAEAERLYRYAALLLGDPETAEDVIQETFLHLFAALRSGTPIRDCRAWLYRVARNACLARRRSRWRDESELPPEAAQPTASPEHEYERRQLARQLVRALSRRELECVRLRAEGLSYAEIADVLHVRCGTVGALLSRALAKCRKILTAR
jgi:RNA polymerase sigma-70 factor (ECF subfamily)